VALALVSAPDHGAGDQDGHAVACARPAPMEDCPRCCGGT
jgi:hypothetical protein